MERIHIIPEPSIKDDQHLREMKQVCRELRDLESRDGLIIEEQHYLDERLKDLQEQEKILKESLATGGAKRPFWLGLGLWGIIAAEMFPHLVKASNDPALHMTIYNASSSQLTLTVMLIIGIVGMPVVIGYTLYVYRVFKNPAGGQTFEKV